MQRSWQLFTNLRAGATRPKPSNKGENIMRNKVYFAVGNIPEHSGFIDERNADDCWMAGWNETGWTYQDVTGSHGTIFAECETREEAQAILDEYLVCDSVETGTYCYTHNPHPA